MQFEQLDLSCEYNEKNHWAVCAPGVLFLFLSDNDDWCHFIVLSHRVVEEDKANGGFVDRHRFRHSKNLDIYVIAIDNGCRNSILVLDMLTELVRLTGSDHGELVKWRHRVRIKSVYL